MSSQQKVLGVMQLDTKFERIPGDIGNVESYDFPAKVKIVSGASVQRVVVESDPTLITPFMEAAKELEAEGVFAITTSCGFMAPFQQEIAEAVNIPVFLSSLLQVPLAYAMTQGRVGILTANSETLRERHLRAAGVPEDIPLVVKGVQDQPAFHDFIYNEAEKIRPKEIEQEILGAAQALLEEYPDIGAFVFECHNMAPYAPAVEKATGKQVFDIISFAHWVYSTVTKREFI
ncbi:MAG: aspartate/glutamate racemase family protein [Chloroflexi bacterium]|nr:aspartate/glutamate racemase family protein [Chloroflexota bacterium]